MNALKRYDFADYLGITSGQTTTYHLMGVGFNSLDENPNAQLDQKTYIHERAQTTNVKGYQPVFPFDTDLISDDTAVMALYEVGRDQKVGANAQFDYVRVDLYDPGTTANTFHARKFKVSVEVSAISGAGGEVVKATGNLHSVGDFTEGTFNTTNNTFTA